MPNRSNVKHYDLAQTLPPATRTTNNTTVAGSAVDLRGYDSAAVEVNLGAWGDTTTGGWEFAVQESDDTVSGNFTDVPNASLTDTIAGSSTVAGASTTGVFARADAVVEFSQHYRTGYLGGKRYIRIKAAATGNQSTGTPFSASVRRGRPANQPTT